MICPLAAAARGDFDVSEASKFLFGSPCFATGFAVAFFSHVIVGATRKPFEIVVRAEDVMERDQHWWYRVASPFGDPLWSPLDIASIFYHGRRINPAFVEPEGDAPVRAAMDAGTDLVVREPVFLDRTYIIDTRVADKWQTEKTAFMSLEYTFTDKKTGRLVAVSRNYSAFMHRKHAPVAATA